MTVAPLSAVTPVPAVMDVAPTHSHVVPEANVTFSRTTTSPEQSGHDERVATAALKFTLGLVMLTFPSVMESPVSTSFDFTEAGVRKEPLRVLLAL